MKKYLLLLSLFFGLLGFSQEKSTNCQFEYDLVLTNTKKDINKAHDTSVTLNWNFSKLNLKDTKVKIEVAPNLDCLNQSGVSQLKESIFFDINSKEFKPKDTKSINHLDIMAKCFRYRVIFSSNNCIETTEWQDYSFF